MAGKPGYTMNVDTPRLIKAAAFRSELAEHVAEGGTIAGFARDRSITERNAQLMWATVRAEMGAQAV